MDKWFAYPDRVPEVAGYYLTIHTYAGRKLCKAFWYSPSDQKWLWRKPPIVSHWHGLRFDYYAPCQLQEKVAPLPISLLDEH